MRLQENSRCGSLVLKYEIFHKKHIISVCDYAIRSVITVLLQHLDFRNDHRVHGYLNRDQEQLTAESLTEAELTPRNERGDTVVQESAV